MYNLNYLIKKNYVQHFKGVILSLYIQIKLEEARA